jgi:sterol desaturase/sphingolipid hydroxylase (fatty acid hydroxylase superfamily)
VIRKVCLPGDIGALIESDAEVTPGPTSGGGFSAIAGRGVNAAAGPTWFNVDSEEDLERMLQISKLTVHTGESVDQLSQDSGRRAAMRGLSQWIAAPLVIGAFVLLVWLERRRPLRKRVEPGLGHHARNFAMAGLGALITVAVETPLIQPLAMLVKERNWGLVGVFRLRGVYAAVAALVLMDYTFYVWHVLLHRAPMLWRFHLVHHVDRDLDTSTALRFHFGELLLSVPWRAAQVMIIGLSPFTFSLWQVWFALCVMFHHSNLRLPGRWDARINRLLVTPRMHGVHHSNIAEETNSNWSSGLTVWDWLHGTLRLNIPQEAIGIGVPAYNDAKAVALPALVVMPFQEQPNYWRFPDGRESGHRLSE